MALKLRGMIRTRKIRRLARMIDVIVLIAVTLTLSALAANAIAAVESASMRAVQTGPATSETQAP